MNRKKIIVTGANGVLGSAFKDKTFLNKYYYYKFIFTDHKTVDLRNLQKTINFFKKAKATYLIHLAAVSGGVNFSNKYQASLLRDNTLMTFNILEAARIFKIKKTILTLTTGMYPAHIKRVMSEEDIHNGYPPINNYGSSFAKRLIDPAIKAYRNEYRLDVIGFIVSNLYGENDNFNLEHTTMLPATIYKAYLAKKNKTKLEIWGNGNELRDYVYAKDVRNIYMWGLKNYSDSKCINICSGAELSIKNIVYKICNIFKLEKKHLTFNKIKITSTKKRKISNLYLKKLYKYKFVNLNEGLHNTIEWFKKNIKHINIKNKYKYFYHN